MRTLPFLQFIYSQILNTDSHNYLLRPEIIIHKFSKFRDLLEIFMV